MRLQPTQDQRDQCEGEQIAGLCFDAESRFLRVEYNISQNVFRHVLKTIDSSILQEIQFQKVEMAGELIDVLGEFQFPQLNSITIDISSIGEAGLKKNIGYDMPMLREISLSSINIGDSSLEILLTRIPDQVEVLTLNYNGICATGLKCLLQIQPTRLHNLKKLYFDGNKIGTRGVQFLIKESLPQLEKLSLNSCQLTDQSIKQLSKGNWPKLNQLNLRDNTGVSGRSLVYSEGTNWKLGNFQTSKAKLCIKYFSRMVRSLQKRQPLMEEWRLSEFLWDDDQSQIEKKQGQMAEWEQAEFQLDVGFLDQSF